MAGTVRDRGLVERARGKAHTLGASVRRRLPPQAIEALRAEGHRARSLVGRGGPPATPPRGRAECPICGHRTAVFLPFGNRRVEPDRKCPRCGSLERHRALWMFLESETDLFTAPHRMLHVAPEPTLTWRLRRLPGLDYLSADLAPGAAEVVMDITDIDRPDDSFDVIYAGHVLEHVPDDRRAMRELRRVLHPDGWAVFQVPLWGDTTSEDLTITDPAERTRLYGQPDHVRMYGRDGELARRLRDSGFDVEVHDLAVELPRDVRDRHRLRKGEDIFLCRVAER